MIEGKVRVSVAMIDEPGFDFSEPSEILDEIAAVTPIYGGISFERLGKAGLQWPCPTLEHPGTLYLYKGKFSRPNGKGQFVPLSYKKSAEIADDDYPLILATDRSLYHSLGHDDPAGGGAGAACQPRVAQTQPGRCAPL